MAMMRESTYQEVLREKTNGASLWRMDMEPASELHVKSELDAEKQCTVWRKTEIPETEQKGNMA